eukprot:769389-Pyramimonas_sp.AAC.1
MRTSNRTKANPAYHPQIDDGSDRCMVVQLNLVDTAVHHDPESHARQVVRNILRTRPVLTLDSEKEYLEGVFISEYVHKPKFSCDKQRQISKWLTTAPRHKPFHKGKLSDRFLREAPSYDECDGWAELPQLLNNWPADKHLETVRYKRKSKHL